LDEICSKYRHVVFDLDGTLIDSMPVWHDSARNFLKSLGIDAEANLNDVLFNLSLIKGAEYIQKTYTPKLSIQEILDGVEGVVEGAYKTSIPLKDGAAEFLQGLKERGLNCAIATSNDIPLVKLALERLQIDRYFDGIFTCTQMNTSKDRPDIYIEAAKALGGSINDTIVFEDVLLATKTAVNAGFAVAAIQDEFSANDWVKITSLATYAFAGY
ncbi:MAG: HAD family phosphatase, partial [Treponemataceae bacterium]|nr:HAD family phosphatase [Treponemataceae bacterium]